MDVPDIGVDELATLRAKGAALIDVRQPDEYEEFHVPGAVLIPLAEVGERIEEVPTGETVYVICGAGPRSAKAVEYLLRQDIDAVNVRGGSNAWRDAGHPIATGPAAG
jgi:rhodanese-related sulfurtransferase